MKTVPPYSALAAGYDLVMSHVDYEGWARHVQRLLKRHQPSAKTILELGCGSGSLALFLQPMGEYRYRATDRSAEMIQVARYKAVRTDAEVTLSVADFTDFSVEEPVDAVILLYDGINYLLEVGEIDALFSSVHAVLRPQGIFLVDQSTPQNSELYQGTFEDEGEQDGFRFHRADTYDTETQLHTTEIEIWIGEQHLHERHMQRAYPPGVIEGCAARAGFLSEAAYADFTLAPADEEDTRVHWIFRKDEEKA